MRAIYELYDALLTIKNYCASKDNTCEDCPLIDSDDCCIFYKKRHHHQIGNWLNQQEDYVNKRRKILC